MFGGGSKLLPEGLVWSGEGGCLIRAGGGGVWSEGVGDRLRPEMATAAVGMHPTRMHSSF